jgi:hypothetical protein
MAEIERNSTGLSGEYFVAAELYRRGWMVGMTIGNAKAVDIYAEKNNIKVAIQVKSIYKKKNIGWPLIKDRIKKDCFYILVNLNADMMGHPDFFILTSNEATKVVKQYTTRGIINLSEVNNMNYKDMWPKLEQ